MKFSLAWCQHSGRIGMSQQDALCWGEHLSQHERIAPVAQELGEAALPLLLAVADGLAVSPGAQRASRLVLVELQRLSTERLSAATVRAVQQSLCHQLGRGKTRGASTTLAAARLEGDRLKVVNTGDSRVYHLTAGGGVVQVSVDHTVAWLFEQERHRAEHRNPSLCLIEADQTGLAGYLCADPEEEDFPVQVSEISFGVGDSLLLCTDGLHDTLGTLLFSDYQPSHSPLDQLELWWKAFELAGAPDNLSAILLRREA